jgi:hypothetical protein
MLYIITAKVKKKDINARKTVNDKVTHLVNAVDEEDAILTINNHYGGKSSSDLSHNVKILEINTTITSPNLSSELAEIDNKLHEAASQTPVPTPTQEELSEGS